MYIRYTQIKTMKTKLRLGALLLFAFTLTTYAQQNVLSKIKTYFTQPVDVSFSKGVNAQYLNNTAFDTLAAYINRAKYTIDVAQYEYKTYTGDPIATALNNAHTRGVKIRYIQDGSYAPTNTGVSLLNAAIPVIASPTGGVYGIMHNKFVIIDEYSTDTTKAIVWTGSPDWDLAMKSGDYNNIIIFQSKVLARAFTHEFDIMWGDTTHGGPSNSTNSKFGPNKPNSGSHHFVIGGAKVDLYFSPSDSTNNHIVTTINSAVTDLYCGMFTFTETTSASDIVNRKNAGAFAAAILDKYSSGTYTPYTTTLPGGLGTNFLGYNSSNTLYHNKYLIVNASAPCHNPTVLTGSHNWTASADSKNDENTVIVYDDTIANQYLQSFAGDFKAISGSSLSKVANPCPPLGMNRLSNIQSALSFYPNPNKGQVTIQYNLTQDTQVSMTVYNMLGENIATLVNDRMLEAGAHTFTFHGNAPGVYLLQVNEGKQVYMHKMIQTE
jgi:phosphatidylserine/phosphatidylglycerophosphate/cardiolipin synthase-like enzyme